MSGNHVLLAFDDSPGAARAVEHVARLVQTGRAGAVTLAYVLPPTPPSLLEHAGGDTPDEERQEQARLDGQRAAWTRAERRAGQAPLERARGALCRAGLAEEDVHEKVVSIVHDADVATSLLEMARELGCPAIVVAREAFAWYRERHASDVADRLLRDARDETVIVVSTQGEPSADRS